MNKEVLVALIVLVGAALVAGFSVVGGPGYARMERHDATRLRDLRALSDYHLCMIDQKGPQTGDISVNRCAGYDTMSDRADPATSEPYAYTRLGPALFQICATFETAPARLARTSPLYDRYDLRFEGQRGCLVSGAKARGDGAEATGATLEWSKD